MAPTSRTTPRSASRTSQRFARPGASPQAGRFARSGGAQPRRSGTPRWARQSGPSRTGGFGRAGGRRSKKDKGIAGAITGMLPTGAASKATPSSKKGKVGGFAALAAAAGMAVRNRDKLGGLMGRQKQQPPDSPATP